MMTTNNKFNIFNQVGNILYGILPTILFALPLSYFYQIKLINADMYTIVGGVIAFIIGSSFTASTLIITMPRENKYLHRLDAKKLIIPYTIVLLLPCLIGILSFIMMFLCQQSDNKPNGIIYHMTTLSIYSTFIQFIWSILVLFMILIRTTE